MREVFTVPLSGDDESSATQGDLASNDDLRNDDFRVDIAAIPCSDQNCRHNLFIEDGKKLKKLDLPSTACVAVSQRFEARAGDTLTYNYVVRLNTSEGFNADRPAVRAVLVNRTAESAVSLMDRSIDGCGGTSQRLVGSHFRDSESFTVPTAGEYELRFMTFVDRTHPGSEAHLLVQAVRLVNPSGREVRRLASLSCVGRVQPETDDESVN